MRPTAAVIVLLAAAPALAAERTALLLHVPQRLEPARAAVLAAALERAARRLDGARVVASAEARDALARDPQSAAARRRAAETLVRARPLADNVRYGEAVKLLEEARGAAEVGLAHLVEPRLLSRIDFELGRVKLIMEVPDASAFLARAFARWPRRPVADRGESPKVLAAMRAAGARAWQVPLPPPPSDVAAQAMTLLHATQLVLITPEPPEPGDERVMLQVFDGQRWLAPRRAGWPAAATGERVSARLTAALSSLIGVAARGAGSDPTPSRGRRSRVRLAAWIATGAAAALGVASAVLFVVSEQRLGDAEALATTPPTVEYSDQAQGFERSARELRTAAIVTLAAAGAAAVGAVVLHLAGRRGRERRRLSAGLSPCGAGLAVRF